MSYLPPQGCPFTIGLKQGANQTLAHDRRRAEKLSRGLHPHGPVALWETRTAPAGEQVDSVEEPETVKPTIPTTEADSKAAAEQSIDVTDAGVTYTMAVGVGNPPSQYQLLIDTGSSITWIGAHRKYLPTGTSLNTNKQVTVSYGAGSFSGIQYEDQVTLGKLVIKKQLIGVASSARGFSIVDGVLGIGPADLTEGTVTGTSTVPTVTDNLYAQKLIPTESTGIFFAPTTKKGEFNGELTFGGADESRYVGDINYVPITQKSPANRYWGVDHTLSYGRDNVIQQSAGIVDTGSTHILLATDAFQVYQNATGADLDQTTGMLTVTEEQYSQMESLFFLIGGVTYELTPNAQIWPRTLNKLLGGEEGKIYLVTSSLGSASGSGLDFILGFAFLQRFYTVYDTTNSRVGFARTRFTDAVSN